MRRLSFHPQVKRDISAAARYYEQQQEGLGADFRAETFRAIQLTETYPLSGTPVDGTVRRQVIRRFPYHLLYRVDGEEIFLLSVAHQHRQPERWRRRL